VSDCINTKTNASLPSAAGASEYWSNKSGYAPNWYSFCSKLICQRITDDPNCSATPWALKKFSQIPVGHLLEIGCLKGDKLVSMLNAGLINCGTGLDFASGAIVSGKEVHGDAITLLCGNLNAPELPEDTFDAISSNGVLHHIENLEICCEALYQSLNSGGILIASEFTGPRRYLYSSREIAAINAGIAMLPVELRGEPFHPGQLTIKLDADPSEAVRTRDIGLVLSSIFDDLTVRPYGGNVLMRALGPKFFAEFDSENTKHTASLDQLIAWDEHVSSHMPSHHHLYVAHKRRTTSV